VASTLLLNVSSSWDHVKLDWLTAVQEDFLVSLVMAFSTQANAISALELRRMAKAVGDLDQLPTTGWVQSFLDRHSSHIQIRKGRKSHKRVILMGVLNDVIKWAEATDTALK
jgi:hypothetical protein